jgi:hypothetical protein
MQSRDESMCAANCLSLDPKPLPLSLVQSVVSCICEISSRLPIFNFQFSICNAFIPSTQDFGSARKPFSKLCRTLSVAGLSALPPQPYRDVSRTICLKGIINRLRYRPSHARCFEGGSEVLLVLE